MLSVFLLVIPSYECAEHIVMIDVFVVWFYFHDECIVCVDLALPRFPTFKAAYDLQSSCCVIKCVLVDN